MATASPFVCIYCKKSSSTKDNLKRHYRTQHPDEELPSSVEELQDPKAPCQYCGKQISKTNMAKHVKNCKSASEVRAASDDVAKSPSIRARKGPNEAEIHDASPEKLTKLSQHSELLPSLKKFMTTKFSFTIITQSEYIEAIQKFCLFHHGFGRLSCFTFIEAMSKSFDTYYNSLETVRARELILHAIRVTLQMLVEFEILDEMPEIVQHQSIKGIISRYFASSERAHFYADFTKDPKKFADVEGPVTIKNFFIVEVLLATSSPRFVRHLTRKLWLDVKHPQHDDDGDDIWVYELSGEEHKIPCFLRHALHKYFVIVRPMLLNRDYCNDESSKFFAEDDQKRNFQVEITTDTFKTFHFYSLSHRYFKMTNFLGSSVDFKKPIDINLATVPRSLKNKNVSQIPLTSRQAGDESSVSAMNINAKPTKPRNQSKEEKLEEKAKHNRKIDFIRKNIMQVKECFANYTKQEINRQCVLTVRIIDDDFDKFFREALECEQVTEEKLADRIVLALKNLN